MEKKLYRSRTERMIWGVCGGLAKYFNLDPTLIRIIFVLLVFASGIGILAYLLMAIVVPLEDTKASQPGEVVRENVEEIKATATNLGRELHSNFEKGKERSESNHWKRRNALGIIVILIGVLALLGSLNLLWWWRWSNFWPVIIIGIGILLIIGSRRK